MRDEHFEEDLRKIMTFIKEKSSLEAALSFFIELEAQIAKISFMPYRYRKNLYKNDENIRDLIFKGYVVPFLIKPDKIIILGIYKHNIPKL